jgi:hypothetical protein
MDSDETAFTDAIYRTNQAFEGSLKEAYRVLAEKSPTKVRPYDIEQHFQHEGALRARVLEQLTIYRTNWRNPSTHDYVLDFDEDEALLAIVSVCAFAIVLIDQISERLSFKQAQATAATSKVRVRRRQPLVRRITALVQQFAAEFNKNEAQRFNVREAELAGALGGFLSSTAPEIQTQLGPPLSGDVPHGPDLLVSKGDEQIILEIKRTKPSQANIQLAIQQVSYYMASTGIKQSIILFYYSRNRGEIEQQEHRLPGMEGLVVVVLTKPSD